MSSEEVVNISNLLTFVGIALIIIIGLAGKG